jgi:hypothetical protein
VETNQTAWNAALRQAVIRVKPDYFALSETERENYRLHMNTEDEFRIRQTILKELFGVVSRTENARWSLTRCFINEYDPRVLSGFDSRLAQNWHKMERFRNHRGRDREITD